MTLLQCNITHILSKFALNQISLHINHVSLRNQACCIMQLLDSYSHTYSQKCSSEDTLSLCKILKVNMTLKCNISAQRYRTLQKQVLMQCTCKLVRKALHLRSNPSTHLDFSHIFACNKCKQVQIFTLLLLRNMDLYGHHKFLPSNV